jgi:rubrerythrin
MKFKLLEGFANVKNFTSDSEIIRLAIQAELDAINLYEQLSTKTNNEQIEKILLDIAFEEKVHVEELNLLLQQIDSEYVEATEEAEKEFIEKGLNQYL